MADMYAIGLRRILAEVLALYDVNRGLIVAVGSLDDVLPTTEAAGVGHPLYDWSITDVRRLSCPVVVREVPYARDHRGGMWKVPWNVAREVRKQLAEVGQ